MNIEFESGFSARSEPYHAFPGGTCPFFLKISDPLLYCDFLDHNPLMHPTATIKICNTFTKKILKSTVKLWKLIFHFMKDTFL